MFDMTTYGQMIYYCLDAVKALSDDTQVTEEHIMFLLDKYRATVLRQTYDSGKAKDGTNVSSDNYQLIPIDKLYLVRPKDLEANIYSDDGLDYILYGSDTHYKSNYKYSKDTKIPSVLPGFVPKVYITDLFKSVATYVDNDRFEYTNWHKYLKNFIYATIGTDRHLYIKSGNVERLELVDKVNIYAVFENPSEVYAITNPDDDLYDCGFPMEDALIPVVITNVVKDILGVMYRPHDKYNNADDDLANIAAFVRQNMKQRYVKDTQDGEE